MKLFDGGATIMIVLLALALIGSVSHNLSDKEHWTKKEEYRGHDATVEQLAETLYNGITGEDRDFTPESPEQK